MGGGGEKCEGQEVELRRNTTIRVVLLVTQGLGARMAMLMDWCLLGKKDI